VFLVWNRNVGCRSSSHKKPSFDAALEFNVAYVATGTGLVKLLKESKVGCWGRYCSFLESSDLWNREL